MKRHIPVILGLAALIAITFWGVIPAPVHPPEAKKAPPAEAAAAPAAPVAIPRPGTAGKVKFAEGRPPGAARPSGTSAASSPAASSGPGNTVRLKGANPLVPASIPAPYQAPPPAINPTIARDLEKVSLMLRDYRTLMGENPVGSNAEIMQAVMGGNPRGARLGPPEGQNINANGELVDAWGTPYFFHQLSADHMEIRSAGPDLKMWTDDDIVRK